MTDNPTSNQTNSDAIDNIILDIAHKAGLIERGKTVTADMLPAAQQAIQDEITRARIHECGVALATIYGRMLRLDKELALEEFRYRVNRCDLPEFRAQTTQEESHDE